MAAEAIRERIGTAERRDSAEVRQKPSRPRSGEPPKAGSSPAADAWHRFVVDVWITDFNVTEFGVYKRSRNKAKSRQFTSDMDIYAEVIENGERTGLLGYREDLWTNKRGLDKRLVFKLFSETLNWRATMDLMLARSLQLTLGARGLSVTAFSVNTDDDEFIVYIERSANKWPLLPEHFSFFLMNDGKPQFYRLRRALINLGGDYTLLDQHNRVVGHLDGKVITLGGLWKGRVKAGHGDKRLLTVLKMFAGMLIFNSACRRHVRQLYGEMIAGRLDPHIERQEADLYMNPRRMR